MGLVRIFLSPFFCQPFVRGTSRIAILLELVPLVPTPYGDATSCTQARCGTRISRTRCPPILRRDASNRATCAGALLSLFERARAAAGSLRFQRKGGAPEEDNGRRIGLKRCDLGLGDSSWVERIDEAGARQRRLYGASARGSDRRRAAVAHAQQMDVASRGPGNEPAGDAGEPRVTADADGPVWAHRRRVVDEEAVALPSGDFAEHA